MSMNIMKNPYDVYVDTEMTDAKSEFGAIMEAAAIRVHAASNEIVTGYRNAFPVPTNCKWSEAGEKHYSRIRTRCENALPEQDGMEEFLRFMRGPTHYTPPRLLGYCFDDRDMTSIVKQFGISDREWPSTAETYDVAHELVFKQWPKARDRSLANTAKVLGIDVDESRLHTPIYDCELTLKVKVELERRIKAGTVPEFVIPSAGFKQAVSVQDSIQTVPSPIVDLKGIPAWNSRDGEEWAVKRYNDPKYRTIKCPKCGNLSIMKPSRNTFMDKYWYCCTNKDCNFSFNVDGTKGTAHQTVICNVEDQVIQ